ncbi:MAG TPA: tetratricopeptide repeat protein [Phycisphaerae bacterium]|nr:tetratricopeptide repeat protein [Phycisphaerae bacterium]HRY69775.1 tetratricopeptide repeat protein [Phycisphaerae bacterium]HSA29251.1 tetratricopeptide repeat protein [Phycisphaerae bacterium]
MSDVSQAVTLGRQLAGRWQIPLFAVSLALLGAGVWRMRPPVKVASFDELFGSVVALKDAGLYAEASQAIELMFQRKNLQVDEKRRLHRLMAEVIHAHESGNSVHGVSNLKTIIDHSDSAIEQGEPSDAGLHRMRAEAFEWQGLADQAVEEYRKALAQNVADAWVVKKRILDIERQGGRLKSEDELSELDAYVAAPDISDDLRYWAAERKMSLLSDIGRHEEAAGFLGAYADRFTEGAMSDHYTYLQALAHFHLGQVDESELQLRALRDRLVPGHALYARTGWLLGRIQQSYQASPAALATFDDVLAKTSPSPYRTLAILGRAEALADLERYDESVEAFREVIRLASEWKYGSEVDLQVVRQTMTVLSESLRTAGQLQEAMACLRLASRLAPPADQQLQAIYAARTADLAYLLGQRARGQLKPGARAAKGDIEQVRKYFLEAAEQYLRLAKLKTADEQTSTTATWRAADALDEAGERSRRAEVFEAYIQQHLRQQPPSDKVPEALLRLGQTYQAMGEYGKAIESYQRNLVDFPRTYWAVQSLVPLAECFTDTRQSDKAEKTLLRIVERQAGDFLAMIEPAAQEYRDALFKLGDLYNRNGDYEKAIARYEEVIDRYPDDPRSDQATFLLANAYRRSAIRMREDWKDPRNLAHKDELKAAHQKRLARAEELFGQVIGRYQARPKDSLSELDRLHQKLSYFYRADAVYDRIYGEDPADLRPYIESMQKYDEAAWLYQQDPMALSAHVQIINCNVRTGRIQEARKALQRAGWALRNIPDENFDPSLPGNGRKYWEDYFAWLGQMPMLSADEAQVSPVIGRSAAGQPVGMGG